MADVRRLPVPVTEIWDWQMRGSCRGMNTDLFFHPERERGPARTAREERAKRVCRGCPVLQQCRVHAIAVQEPYGVWGGLTVNERDEQIRAAADQTGPAASGGARPVVVGADCTRGQNRPRPPTPGPWPAA